jgi:hypothetical protein
MNPAASAQLVRRWVALYTRGLSDGALTARRDEIESDLWSQRQEALDRGQTDGAVASEMLTRLLLGIPADVVWRLEQAGAMRANQVVERRVTIASRTVGLLAVLGGLASTISIGMIAVAILARPDELYWNVVTDPTQRLFVTVLGVGGLLAISAATAGLAYLLIDRIDEVVVLLAVVAGLGGVLGLMGADGAFLLLLVGSPILMLYLARAHLMNPWIAVGHAVAAGGWIAMLWLALARDPLGATSVFGLSYPMSWILIGAWVLRGIPNPRPSNPTRERRPSGPGTDLSA